MASSKRQQLRIEAVPDPERAYSTTEQERLTANLESVTRDVAEGHYRTRRLDDILLRALHARLFAAVRSWAGRQRSRDWGSEVLIFGENRSRTVQACPTSWTKCLDERGSLLLPHYARATTCLTKEMQSPSLYGPTRK